MDNFQIRGYREADGCAFDDSPLKTGFPDNITHPCDPNPTATYVDSSIFAPCLSKVYRTWTVTDDCGNSTTSGIKQVISIIDTTGPVITCPSGNLLSHKADTLKCYYSIDSSLDAKALDACTLDSVTIKNNYNNKGTLKGEKIPVGLHSITWTATDQCGNKSTCKYLLNIFETEPPIAKCKNFTIYLTNNNNNNGLVTIKVDSIDAGSTDNCAVKTRKLSREDFDCDLLNQQKPIFLTITDSSGLSDTCQAIVTIKDTFPPVIVCKNITISIPANGIKIITADSVLTSAKDNCGIPIIGGKMVKPDTFTCTSPKVTTVTVTVTDNSGNKATCTPTVTISNADGDCDGVFDVCDVCPKTDDRVDNDKDGKPDCNVIPTFANILSTWKCSTVPQRVYISEIVNGVCTTLCVTYSTFRTTRKSNQYLGPCIMCGGNLSGKPGRDNLAEVSLNEQNSAKIKENKETDFKIIPNPNFGSFEIVFDKPVQEGIVEIYNMLDEAVWKKVISNETDKIILNTTQFKQASSGVYWIVFKNKDAKIIKSMLITK